MKKITAFIAKAYLEGNYKIPNPMINAHKTWDAFNNVEDIASQKTIWDACIQAGFGAISKICSTPAIIDDVQYDYLQEIAIKLWKYYTEKPQERLFKSFPSLPDNQKDQEKFKKYIVTKACGTLIDILRKKGRISRDDDIATKMEKMKIKVDLEKHIKYFPPEHPLHKVFVSTDYFEIDEKIFFISDNAFTDGLLNSKDLLQLSFLQTFWEQIDWNRLYRKFGD